MPKSPPNKALQQTGAAILVPRGIESLQAAPAAELRRSLASVFRTFIAQNSWIHAVPD